jgi:hypothetical protein
VKQDRKKRPVKTKAREPEERRRKVYKEQLDERLDEALKETFPASDPVALTPRPPRQNH